MIRMEMNVCFFVSELTSIVEAIGLFMFFNSAKDYPIQLHRLKEDWKKIYPNNSCNAGVPAKYLPGKDCLPVVPKRFSLLLLFYCRAQNRF